MNERLKILSLGLGVQSSAIYLQSSMGILPRLDYAIFADPGKEKKKTYEYLVFLQEWGKKNNGIEIIVRNDKNLYTDLMNRGNSTGQRFASIPAYTMSESEEGKAGMLKRQCTYEYKIAVIDNAIRELYGLPKGSRRPITEVWKGITMDEYDRMSAPIEAWKWSVYPYCGYEWHKSFAKGYRRIQGANTQTRQDLISWYISVGIPIPPKSSCLFCPFQSEHSWYNMKVKEPQDFEDACKVDEAIRDLPAKGLSQPIFLHDSLKPLRHVKFDLTKPDIFSGECSGNCHT